MVREDIRLDFKDTHRSSESGRATRYPVDDGCGAEFERRRYRSSGAVLGSLGDNTRCGAFKDVYDSPEFMRRVDVRGSFAPSL